MARPRARRPAACSLLRAMLSISLVCAVADAPSAAAAVRVPMLFTGAVATGAPPPPQCDPGDFAGEAAARVDVAEMDADWKSVPAFRRRGWPAPGYARCVHCVNARSATSGGVERCAETPAKLPLLNHSDVSPPPIRPVSVEQLVLTGRSSPIPVYPLHTQWRRWNQPRRSGGGRSGDKRKRFVLGQADAHAQPHSSGRRLRRGGSSGGGSGFGSAGGSV